MMDPFELFPEEIWEMILDNLGSCQDAWNLFQALPKLHAGTNLQKRKHLWLFGQILPHVIPWNFTKYIEREALLNCRLVCKRWSAHVDIFLTSLLKLRSHHPTFYKSQGHCRKRSYDGVYDPKIDEEDYQHPFGGTRIDCSKLLKDPDLPSAFTNPLPTVLKNMEGYPPERNPFVGRCLSFSFPREDGPTPAVDRNMLKFGEDAISLHKTFGKHVWTYMVDFIFQNSPLQPSLVGMCLGELPNLRSLHVNIFGQRSRSKIPKRDVDEFVEEIADRLPPLPNLETLAIETNIESFGNLLITRFAQQIKRLELEIWLWRDEYSDQFPNLEGLQVTLGKPDHVEVLKKMLRCLEAPKMTKLQFLWSSRAFDDGKLWTLLRPTFLIERDVYPWLRKFPRLEYLSFGDEFPVGQVIMERGTLSPRYILGSSLKYLTLRGDPQMVQKFLACLQKLQHLKLHVGFEVASTRLGTVEMRNSTLWKPLSELRTLTVNVESVTGKIEQKLRFNREEEEYEYERRRREDRQADAKKVMTRMRVKNKDEIETMREGL